MTQFLVTTVIACLTRQDLEALMQDLRSAPSTVRLERSWANLTDGKMVCVFTTATRTDLEQFLKLKHVRAEWVLPVELEWS